MKTITVKKKIDYGIYYDEEEYTIIVDDNMYEILNKYNWYMNTDTCGYSYAKAHTHGVISSMHSFIIGCPIKPYVTDHIDGNRNNCQRGNLEIVTQRQNMQNMNVSRYKLPGVNYCPRNSINRPWRSYYNIGNTQHNLGYFKTKVEAFFKYKEAIESLGEVILPRILEKCYRIIDSEMVHI